VDGRVVRALLARGLIRRRDGWIAPTEEATVHLAAHDRQSREARTRRSAQSPRNARAQAVLRAVEELEKAVPSDAEVIVGDQPAYADDVLAGLRRFARRLAATRRDGD
jgi:glutathione S-transferase